jgi:hypothetical protein
MGGAMDMFEAAKKLYLVGYSHEEVRCVWAYAYNEQHLPDAKRKRRKWEAVALDEAQISPFDIDFPVMSPSAGVKSNYF